MRKTAIDYLVEELTSNGGVIDVAQIQKAKEMEKQQIINAYLKDRRRRDFLNALKLMDKAEQYYHDTFKSE